MENQRNIKVHEIVQLARTAVVDTEVEVRLNILKGFSSMDINSLYFLAQEDVLSIISMTLYDEDYRIQEEAIFLLSEIANINPAMVLPRLRKVLLDSISLLTNSYVPNLEEHSARIIAKLSVQLPNFMSPYFDSVLMALLSHLQPERRSKVEVTVQVINALSELSLIGGLKLVHSVDKIFPSLIGFLHDSISLNRREASLRALGVICQSTGYVVDPYKDYLDLLNILLKLLKTELSPSMRHLTMRVMGVIGALDPYTHKVYLGKIYSHRSNTLALSLPNIKETGDNKSDVSDILQWINYERYTLFEYYSALTIANLVEILQDDALTAYHQEVVNVLSQIFRSLGSQSSKYVGQVVPKLLKIIEDSKPELRKLFLSQFLKFVAIVGQELRPHMKEILEMTDRAWNRKDGDEFRLIIINVLEEIGRTFGLNFTPYVTDLCPFLLDVIENDRSEDKRLVMKALSCVGTVVRCVGDHIHFVLPPVLSVLDDRHAPLDVRLTALDTLILLARTHPIGERAPTIMQTWLRVITVEQLQPRLMELLHFLIQELSGQFLIYKDIVNMALIRYNVNAELRKDYLEHINQIITMIELDAENSVPVLRIRERHESADPEIATQHELSTTIDGREHRLMISIDQLRRFWSVSALNSRNEWLQWLTTLRAQFVRQSPSAFIRACANLSDSHEPLAKSLFNAAFISVWTEINEFEQDELSNQLIDVLTSCPHAEPIQAILNLAEFMDHSEKGPLPVTHGTLSKCAEQTRAYAKAIRYKELEIIAAQHSEPNSDDCQALITFANKLNVEEYAAGVVQYAEKIGMDISGRWYEKLGEWNKALEMYQAELSDRTRNRFQPQMPDITPADITSPQSVEESEMNKEDIVIYQMRCLEALGRWNDLLTIGQNALDLAEPAAISPAQHPNGNSAAMRFGGSGTISNTGYLSVTLNEAEKRQRIAQMAARASWASGDYDGMSKYVQLVNQNTQEGAFLRAVLAIKNDEFKDAMNYISKVREMYDSDLTAMVAESYERAYGAVVVLQQLTELEEAIEYKMIPERQPRIAVLWSRRIQGCSQNIAYWQRIIHVRSIVMTQTELRPTWIKYAAMCRRQGRLSMARNVLTSLIGVPADSKLFPLTAVAFDEHSPQLAFAVCKQLWIEGQRKEALIGLQKMAMTFHRLIDRQRQNQTWTSERLEASSRMTAKCFLKLGEWHALVQTAPLGNAVVSGSITAGINVVKKQQKLRQRRQQKAYTQGLAQSERQTSVILKYYSNATKYNPTWYKAWHRLATTYYNLVMTDRQSRSLAERVSPLAPNTGDHQVCSAEDHATADADTANHHAAEAMNAENSQQPDVHLDIKSQTQPNSVTQSSSLSASGYAARAVRYFFSAMLLAETGSRLDDTLRLLMLWFDYGEQPDVLEVLQESLPLLPIENWLEVMPQLIARLDSHHNIGALVKQLIIDISKMHPQALIYALMAAAKSRNSNRSRVTCEILQFMAQTRPVLVEQARLLNDELIRCAILWNELWHKALEDASRFYFQEHSVEEMMNVLRPLHAKVMRGHETLKEQSFIQTHYQELNDAFNHCEEFHKTSNTHKIQAAWELYFSVFKKISTQLRMITFLDLNHISPRLADAKNLELTVPGTYEPNGTLVTIVSLHHHLQVIASKQRPRKIYIKGSDGKEYAFLLKGHEDPRQDERIMQLFGLLNTLILRDPDTCRRNISIQRYSITTLSQTSGLIGWLPSCDTLHALIKDYREKRGINLSNEHLMMRKMVVDLDTVTLIQKVEVFEETLRVTDGDDLRQTLWIKSPNSEVWFERRTNYTRSMACMSMVGYILGLGDRHPSNLMLDRMSGKIVHIDFGDCFEVTMIREKFPEKIPFRLTRMLVRAMEMTGIEGNYRLTCERVLHLLRNSKDSILAVLESFVYDPVVNWRLANGRDFDSLLEISVSEQVTCLIEQATSSENLCQCYIGWCPFW